MRDIALAAGVSQSTVSRVLNDVPTRVPIAAETRERVTLAARKLGYRPNPLARGLRGAPTMLLGAVVRDITDPFFAGAVEALSVAAMSHGYNLVLGHARGRADEALALTAVLETRHCDAIVLLGDLQDQPRLFADLADLRVPVVGLWQGSSPLGVPTVDVDNKAGIGPGWTTSSTSATNGSRSSAAGRWATSASARRPSRQYMVEPLRRRAGRLHPARLEHAGRRRGRDRRPVRARASHRRRSSPRPTRSRSVRSTRPTARACVVPDDLSVVGFDDILLRATRCRP